MLAPVIDSVNHDSRIGTALGFDGLRQEFTLAVDKAYKSGEQVCAYLVYDANNNNTNNINIFSLLGL